MNGARRADLIVLMIIFGVCSLRPDRSMSYSANRDWELIRCLLRASRSSIPSVISCTKVGTALGLPIGLYSSNSCRYIYTLEHRTTF